MANSDDERDILQCDDRRFKAMVRGDLTALRLGLSDDLTYTRTSGRHETKAQVLALLARGQISYKSIVPEARSVRVYGGVGMVTAATCFYCMMVKEEAPDRTIGATANGV